MLAPAIWTLIMYALGFYLCLLGVRGVFMVVMGVRERLKFEKALRRAGL